MAGDIVIRAEALTKRYGDKVAVDRIDLEVRAGEIVGILGPNGSGKTTTILMLLGLTEPTGGRATVSGFDPLREPLEVKRRVGYLPDQIGLLRRPVGARQPDLHRAARRAHPRRDRRAVCRGARSGRPCRIGAGARLDLLARHAPASRPRRNPDEAARRWRSSTSRPPRSTRIRRRNSSAMIRASRTTARRCCCPRTISTRSKASATGWRCSTAAVSPWPAR